LKLKTGTKEALAVMLIFQPERKGLTDFSMQCHWPQGPAGEMRAAQPVRVRATATSPPGHRGALALVPSMQLSIRITNKSRCVFVSACLPGEAHWHQEVPQEKGLLPAVQVSTRSAVQETPRKSDERALLRYSSVQNR
jgi:hypothetical protein